MKQKIVVITGASSGIGKALALEFASRGSKIVLAARNLEKLKEVEESILALGNEVLAVKTDVSVEEDCKNLITETVNRFGGVDVLINNAGISMRALFTDLDLSVIKNLMDVNFWGTVYCTKFAMPYITKSKGSVVGVISIAGYIGLPARSGYSASKYAIRGFLDTLRVENLKTGVHVLVAAPGFTASNVRNVALTADGSMQGETPRDESKMMSAEECARLIAIAVVKRKRELIMTFMEGKLTVWLKKWFPSLLEKLTYNHMAKEPDSPLK
ncbi:SDR family oxidoreductase [Labilibaculum euxinus]|uniref:SDR family oxidoreductase n=1 Tax=Labilibaculum euxinus TaxID=2686357 RepID=A0A7M4DAT0_9BACT|nr:SDR family oxidoreductase [Labilibaculum euxinus]MUP39759.1 SDR family oxidoreductase [Labilibaculum euxinus]MVB08964.1 SDR family oxidoreductase [Labilibaculum euxinus]